ncbi:cysteine--tRNA ligase, partial [Candidatus Microgenomates bacterium]|nr:cysteine--tRNA ligase [Candidatus Microgenomates bacterium]
ALMWEVVKSNIPPGDKLDLILNFDQVFGLKLAEVKTEKHKIPAEVKKLVEEREKARQEEKWPEADKIRKKVKELGFIIEDTPGGVRIREK